MAEVVSRLSSLLDWRSILVVALTTGGFYFYVRKKRSPPLPPGPKGLPLIGNALDIPTANQWLKFAEFGDAWGNIMSLNALGKTLIIINSNKVAEDLLEGHGVTFANRPVGHMFNLSGFDNWLIMCEYGDRVRSERRLFHQLFGTHVAIYRFEPLLAEEVHKLVRSIAAKPEGFVDEIKRTTVGIMLRLAYGYHLCDGPEPDPFLKMYETTLDNFNHSILDGFFVDSFPICDAVLARVVAGRGIPNHSQNWSKQVHDSVDTTFQYVKKQMAAGTAEPSFVSALLEQNTHEDYLIKWAAASMAIAGSDTTAAQLEAFFLVMSLYPDVEAAAQEELDRIVGSDRLPGLSDRAQLPYVDALCKELLRWHVAAPTGIPHRPSEDVIYDRSGGLGPVRIPKDSVIITNAWRMAHDPATYADRMAFNPNRFLAADGKEPEPDPGRFSFGHGRRICPGRLMADATIFVACSALLSVFNISKIRRDGVVVEPRVGQTSSAPSSALRMHGGTPERAHVRFDSQELIGYTIPRQSLPSPYVFWPKRFSYVLMQTLPP
ncbi:cytochrome P450 [Mycena polygramma]|nr:cytochrome P450 [Mycena polygramma]